jgi:hypothetical protein
VALLAWSCVLRAGWVAGLTGANLSPFETTEPSGALLRTSISHRGRPGGTTWGDQRTHPVPSRPNGDPSKRTGGSPQVLFPFARTRGPVHLLIASLAMSMRLDPSWSVLSSPSTAAVDRCVDIFRRPDGTFGFEEFRRDPEDMGSWTPIAYYSVREFRTEDDATATARSAVPWLPAVLDDAP